MHFIDVADVDRIPAGRGLSVGVGERRLALFRLDDETLCAIENSCPHNGASLASGQLDGPFVRCPAHGLQFDVRNGCMRGNPDFAAASFPVKLAGGRVLVALPNPSCKD